MTIWQKVVDAVSSVARPESLAGALGHLGGAPGASPDADIRFTMALIALCAKMARSDGAVTHDEVEAFKRVVLVEEEDEPGVRRVFDLAKQDVAGYEEYARQIAGHFGGNRQLIRDVIEALCVVAAADGVLHEKEDAYLKVVARHFGLPDGELAYIRSLFVRDAAGPYEILGLTPAATDAEVRARHRALVLENHPDRLTGRGVPAEFVKVAERKLAAINAAFDAIAGERGL